MEGFPLIQWEALTTQLANTLRVKSTGLCFPIWKLLTLFDLLFAFPFLSLFLPCFPLPFLLPLLLPFFLRRFSFPPKLLSFWKLAKAWKPSAKARKALLCTKAQALIAALLFWPLAALLSRWKASTKGKLSTLGFLPALEAEAFPFLLLCCFLL
jgi:hypothetical protein